MTKLSLLFIRVYQRSLGRVFAVMSSCRYEPSCSHYGYQAIQRFGAFRGWRLALGRIGRCQPFGGHGYDPVPERWMSRRDLRAARQARQAAGDRGGIA
ncbi:MAG: hypothetical protein NVSMB29_07990 [Candidatus Dormibacteria bacterium]